MRSSAMACATLLVACVPEPPPPVRDAGVHDAGVRDAGSRDGGSRDGGVRDAGRDGGPRDGGPRDGGPRDAGPTICPTSPNVECTARVDCNMDLTAPSNCDGCFDYNRALCVEGACATPPAMGAGDIYTVVVTVPATVGITESFAATIVSVETAGNAQITCDDVYADTVDLSDRCYNVLDSRGYTVPQMGDTYAVSFTSFASGQRSLFIITAYDRLQAGGNRTGMSCTPYDVPGPRGGGPYYITGDMMRPL